MMEDRNPDDRNRMTDTLYLIDGHAQLYRAYHAAPNFRAPDGTPTGAVHGFCQLLLNLLEIRQPRYIAACFDPVGETFRHTLDAEYKANREPMPDDLKPQVPIILEACKGFKVPVYRIDGFEADDVIGTLTERAVAEGIEVMIVSADKDLMQLVRPGVSMYDAIRDKVYTPEEVYAAKGVRPDQIADWLALMGDASDNIRGVEKVGAKTAVELLKEHQTLDGVLAWAERTFGAAVRAAEAASAAATEAGADATDVSGDEAGGKKTAGKPKKLKPPKAYERNLVLQAERAREGRKLATLDRQAPIGEFAMDHCRFAGVDAAALHGLFRPLSLRMLDHHVNRLEKEKPEMIASAAPVATATAEAERAESPAESTPATVGSAASDETSGAMHSGRSRQSAAAATEAGQGNLFAAFAAAEAVSTTATAEATARTAENLPFQVRLVQTAAELQELTTALQGVQYLAWDTETTSEQPMIAEPVGISLCWSEGEAWYVALECGAAKGLKRETALQALRPMFEAAAVRKVAQNGKYDWKILKRAGVTVRGMAFDTMIAGFLLDPGHGGYGIDALSLKYLNYTKIPTEAIIGTGKTQITMDQAPVSQVATYACEDAWATWRLAGILETRLKEENLWSVMAEIEQPLVETLAAMEYEGIYLDAEVLKVKGEEVRKQLVELAAEIHRLAGREFNIDSPSQLGEVLFTQLALPVIRKSAKTKAPSTDEHVLTVLGKQHPLPAKVLEYRTLAKLLGTYIEALPKAILPTTGRVHASFLQTGAATGRLASWNPNLQNIPVRRDQGSAIRAAFKPRQGWKFLACDYSQIELRLLAHYADDENLRAAFRRGEDIHRAVAAKVFHVAPEAVTDEQRSRAKAVDFGILYGQGAHGLAEVLGIKRGEAKQIIDDFFAEMPGVAECREQILNTARANGYVTTLKGRKRYIPEIHAAGFSERAAGERMAVNTVFQGSAADLIKEAMNAIQRRLSDPAERWQAKMLLQIHDELLFEAPVDEIERLKTLVVSTMESIEPLHVPLKVSAAVGGDWSEV